MLFGILSIFFLSYPLLSIFSFFFFNDTATTEIYTLSLHDALPIWSLWVRSPAVRSRLSSDHMTLTKKANLCERHMIRRDRKSTRLNSSHQIISYAVFCLKKKKKKNEMGNRWSVHIHEGT